MTVGKGGRKGPLVITYAYLGPGITDNNLKRLFRSKGN